MRLLYRSLAFSLLVSITVVVSVLMIMFSRHYRLTSIHGNAELRQGGATIMVVPRLGYGLDTLRRPLPLLGLVIVPAGCLIGRELRQLWRHYARPGYSVRLKP